ncbi:MAG: LPS export ABC transporter periplasmic protein LptC [Hyphomicrobiales bacterium]|nr:LPS export ABC transporter periplasmic protein LptC [Hyphomicrobiales bacterium]
MNRRHYSAFVRKLKLAIVGAVVLLLLILIIWPLFKTTEEKLNLTTEGVVEEGERPTMERPRFYGLDENNNPYNLVAEEAVQADDNSIQLHKINGDVVLKDGTWVAVVANEATADVTTRKMYLTGAVNIFMDSGFEVFTESAVLDLPNGMLEGDEEVVIQGPQGLLQAQGFRIRDSGKNMDFKGRVKVLERYDAPAKQRVQEKRDALRARKPEHLKWYPETLPVAEDAVPELRDMVQEKQKISPQPPKEEPVVLKPVPLNFKEFIPRPVVKPQP